jgi:peptidoglycan hydrolase CwlO-like protein
VTTKDKTGDELMASIRKTKTEGATADKAPAAAPQASLASAETATRKAKPVPVRRPRTTKKTVAARPKTKPDAAKAEVAAYQSTGRVWPD